jgi:hypothetical protein
MSARSLLGTHESAKVLAQGDLLGTHESAKVLAQGDLLGTHESAKVLAQGFYYELSVALVVMDLVKRGNLLNLTHKKAAYSQPVKTISLKRPWLKGQVESVTLLHPTGLPA